LGKLNKDFTFYTQNNENYLRAGEREKGRSGE